MRSNDEGRNSTAAALVKGAIAGAVGVWALDQVTTYMWDRENPEALQQEEQARPEGMDPAHIMANRAAEAVGVELGPKQPNLAGILTHYSLGILPGALYGLLRKRGSKVTAGHGLLFGIGLFLLQDELANWALGTSGAPRAYPWQAHARGVAGHIAYGTATDATYSLLERAA